MGLKQSRVDYDYYDYVFGNYERNLSPLSAADRQNMFYVQRKPFVPQESIVLQQPLQSSIQPQLLQPLKPLQSIVPPIQPIPPRIQSIQSFQPNIRPIPIRSRHPRSAISIFKTDF